MLITFSLVGGEIVQAGCVDGGPCSHRLLHFHMTRGVQCPLALSLKIPHNFQLIHPWSYCPRAWESHECRLGRSIPENAVGEEGVQQIMKMMVGGGLFLRTNIYTGMIAGSTYHWSQLQMSQCFPWGGGWCPMGRGLPCKNSLRMLGSKQQKKVKWHRWALCTGGVLHNGWVSYSGQLHLKRRAGSESYLCSWIHCRTSCFRHLLCIVSFFCTLLKEQTGRCLPRLQLTR